MPSALSLTNGKVMLPGICPKGESLFSFASVTFLYNPRGLFTASRGMLCPDLNPLSTIGRKQPIWENFFFTDGKKRALIFPDTLI